MPPTTLQVKTISNATVYPVNPVSVPYLLPGQHGGVVDKTGKPVLTANLDRHYTHRINFLAQGAFTLTPREKIVDQSMIYPKKNEPAEHHLKGTHIFAGYLFDHFGHFLLESLARLWYIRENPTIPLVWIEVLNKGKIFAPGREILDILGVENPIHIITCPTSVEKLIVPEAGYVIQSSFHQAQAKALKVAEALPPKPEKKVWLSRSKLTQSFSFNEHTLEHMLEGAGWTIYHPQDHSVRDQLAFLADAGTIAGCEGSAFHTLVLIPDIKSRIIIFGRGRHFNVDYCMIAQNLGLNQEIYQTKAMMWSHGLQKWELNTYWSSLDPLLEILTVKRPVSTTPLPINLKNISVALVRHFNLRQVAEFYATSNSIFEHVKAGAAFSVSALITFDPAHIKPARCIDAPGEMFLTSINPNTVFDLFVFRQHPHFDEMLRAFHCSLTLSSKKTFWIIEIEEIDSIPTTPAGQLLNFIQDFHTNLSLARVAGTRYFVLWHARRPMQSIHADGFKAHGAAATNTKTIPALSLTDIATLVSERKNSAGDKIDL